MADRLQRVRDGLFRERRRRRRLLADGFDPRWHQLIEANLAPWPHLGPGQRERLEQLTLRHLAGFRWEAAYGFTVTEAMTVTIAAHAGVLLLELPGDSFHDVTSVIIHPTTMLLRGPRPGPVPWVVTDTPLPISGQTEHRGPVVLAWDAVRRESRHPEWGEHVVYHEFAHRLDLGDGTIDGTPRFAEGAARQRWVEVCTPVYRNLRRELAHPLLRPYAAAGPGEFFAVTTETFFTRGADLRASEPDLYDVFASYYGQDPASWWPASDDVAAAEGTLLG